MTEEATEVEEEEIESQPVITTTLNPPHPHFSNGVRNIITTTTESAETRK